VTAAARAPIVLPVIEPAEESPAEVAALQAEIHELARKRNAVVLAHNYQRPEVQDVADYVGDSLGLSRQAARTEAEVIVFAGVHFMAETAAILSPAKKVLLPDLRAGCSLAATITADDVRQWKAQFPDYISVKAVAVPGGSALVVWSRARFGYGDFGVNRSRIEDWLDRIGEAGPG